MKYDIIIEDLVPRRRETTVKVPDDEDDPAEYLREHPELWRDPKLTAAQQDVAGLRAAVPPEALAPDTPLELRWTTVLEHEHLALVSVRALHQALADGKGNSVPAFLTVLDATICTSGDADITGLDPWLSQLETSGVTTFATRVTGRVVHPVVLAADQGTVPPGPEQPAIPGEDDLAVTFDFAEHNRGTGSLALSLLADEGLWEPGQPVTEQVLADYFSRYGTGPGRSTGADTSFSGIGFTNMSRQVR